MRRLVGLSFVAFAWCACVTTPVSAQNCDPRSFADIEFSQFSEVEQLVLLSTSSESKLKEMQAKHKGEMIIPYINVPASGDFAYSKRAANQLITLMYADLTREAQTTALHSRLTSLGVQAYMACLRSSRAWITVGPDNLTSTVVNITINWASESGNEGDVGDVLVVNGKLRNEVRKKVSHNGAVIAQVERLIPTEKTTITVMLDRYVAEITLPPPQKYKLVTEPFVFPQAKVVAASNHANGYGRDQKGSVPPFTAPAGTEILLGSVKVVGLERFNEYGDCSASASEKVAELSCFAHATTTRGASAAAFASGVLLKVVPLEKRE